LVAGLGKQKIIFGFPWLNEYDNPNINWKTENFTWREANKRRIIKIKRHQGTCRPLELARKLARQAIQKTTIEEEEDKDKGLNRTQNPSTDNNTLLAYINKMEEQETIWVRSKTTKFIEFHLQFDEKKEEIPLEKQVPKEYHEYLDVFDENKAD
jgi:hypothetical protein